MAVKAKIEKLEDVPESLRGEYKEQDGAFYLDIEGLDDHHGVGALKRAKDYEKDEAKKHKERADSLTSELDKVRGELVELKKNGIPKGDVENLEKSYKEQLEKREKELSGKIDALTASLEKHLLDGGALQLASKLAAKPEFVEVLMPHIRGRLKIEEDSEGRHNIRVLDKEGKLSASSLEDLEKELLSNKAFAGILTGSKASGGGASGGSGRGGASSKKFGELTEQERTEWYKEDPEGFRKASEEHKRASRS